MVRGRIFAAPAGPAERACREYSGKSDPNEVFVEVRDSGQGFDQVNLSQLFDSFYSTKPEGMGMGLSISRSIVEAHGGRLWATPNDPHGAVFRFVLPLDGDRNT